MNLPSSYDPLPENTEAVLSRIGHHDRVLDVGGWWKPFTRANYVIDYLPYDTRGGGGFIGLHEERFSKDTWFQLDLCAEPFPFEEKSFEYVYCGNVLEDVRDPIRVCHEIMRVGRAGYVECPTIWIECQFGVDDDPLAKLYPGFRNHRWLVDVDSEGLTFIPKLSILSALTFVPLERAEEYRRDQRVWAFGFFWQESFKADVWVYPDRKSYIERLRRYFATFDCENPQVLYGN